MDFSQLIYFLKLEDETLPQNSQPFTTRYRLFNPVKKEKTILKDKLNVRTAKSRPLAKNHRQIQDWLKAKISKDLNKADRYQFLMRLCDVLKSKLKIIPFRTKTHNEAFTLFEVLNDRGLQVSQADLLKNLCIKKGDNYLSQKEMYDQWQEIIDKKLEENNKVNFLRTSYNSKEEFIRKNELYDGYKKILKDITFDDTISFIKDGLSTDVENYNQCLLEGSVDLPLKIQKWITLLYHTDTTQWRTLALALLRLEDKHSKNELVADILSEVFEIIFTMIANETRFNEIETEFPAIAIKIEEDKLIKTLNELKVFKVKRKLSYGNARVELNDLVKNSFCALLLLMYKSSSDDISSRKYTVEHILPQNPKSKDWAANFPNLFDKKEKVVDDAKEKSIYSVGNLMLLEDKQNKSLGNLSFDKKVKKMKSMQIKDVISVDNDYNIYKIDDFNQNAIDSRLNEIKKVLSDNFVGLKI